MKWSEFFTSSVGKKFVMGMTGLFLIAFLIVHVGVNACIFATIFNPDDNGEMFNKAAHFMGATVVIRILELGLFAGFFIHIIQGLLLEFQNRRKRGVAYQVSMGNRGSKWYSRSMGLLGTIILLFLIIHWKQFWVPSRFTGVEETIIDGKPVHDLFSLMKSTFSALWVVLLYVVACISLAYHLLHGFQSAFRSIGLHNTKYLKMANAVGVAFSIIVPLLFALMPVSMYLHWVQ
ncbi:MAG: succinate dehydrogenase cytochrome b subunit [Bacteroidetes bacterium]|nr:succinate dehydrogenase cytochrome b subunit [Bacteroidota bacterium]MBS1973382.1 succinate dehydrogenase cytochrome b subunit [Bacteroidota bacterium]